MTTCPTCKGELYIPCCCEKGKVEQYVEGYNVAVPHHDCQGTGKIPCPGCARRGIVTSDGLSIPMYENYLLRSTVREEK